MRIALYHNAPTGGAKRAIYEWSRKLSLKHVVDVYSLSSAAHDFCDIRPYVAKHMVTDFRESKMLRSPFGRLNQLLRWHDLGRLAKTEETIAKRIDAEHYDVVFAHTCRFSVIPSLIQMVKTPVVYYLHEPFGTAFKRSIDRPYFTSRGWRDGIDQIDPFIRLYTNSIHCSQMKSVKKVRLMLANSSFTQSQMKIAFDANSIVCHYGVNTEQFSPLENVEKENILVSVGELSARKGYDFLIESLALVPPARRPTLRVIANRVDVNERAFLENLASAKGVSFHILSNLNSQELCQQYNRARFCVYAPYLEPFGLVPLEAMACGVAVIGVREGGVEESVIDGKTGILVERDTARFAAAIEQLLDQPALSDLYGKNGRRQVLQAWTWDKASANLESHLMASANQQTDVKSHSITAQTTTHIFS